MSDKPSDSDSFEKQPRGVITVRKNSITSIDGIVSKDASAVSNLRVLKADVDTGKASGVNADTYTAIDPPLSAKGVLADNNMKLTVAKVNLLEEEYEKRSEVDAAKLANNEITQQEYDASVSDLKAAFAAKEAELRIEVEETRRALDEANAARQAEMDEAHALHQKELDSAKLLKEQEIAAVEEQARVALAAAERDRAEALALKREAEELRAAALVEVEKAKEQIESERVESQKKEQAAIAEESAKRVIVEEKLKEARALMAKPKREYEVRMGLTDEQLNDESESLPQPIEVSNPSSNPSSSVKLTPVTQNLERLFQIGRNVIRFQADKPPVFASIFIRELVPGTGSASSPLTNSNSLDGNTPSVGYSLCWSKADDRTGHPSRSLPFVDLTAIVLGKQSAVFKQPTAMQSPERCCVSFIARPAVADEVTRKSLHVEFGSEREADTWLYGIASLMKEYGLNPALYTRFGQYTENDSNKNADHLLSEVSDGSRPSTKWDRDSIAAANQLIQYKIEVALACNNVPTAQTTATSPSEAQQQPQQPQAQSNIVICMVERNDRTNQLEYRDQTEAIEGSTKPRFKKRFPCTYIAGSGKALRFNVYDLPLGSTSLSDADRIGSAIIDVKSLVDRPGAEFVYTLSHRDESKRSRLASALTTISVICVSKVQLLTASEEEAKSLREQIKIQEQLVSTASRFTNYVDGVGAQDIHMFYTPGQPPADLAPSAEGVASDGDVGSSDRFYVGHLNWSPIGGRPHLMPLTSIVDVFVGRKAKVFPDYCRDDRCFSLVSNTGARLDLEAHDAPHRQVWVETIIGLLKAAALQRQQDAAAATNSKGHKRQASTNGATVPAAAAAAAQGQVETK